MLKAKVALVTGSVAGLGNAIAEGLANAGADVVLTDFCDEAEGSAAARRLAEKTGANVSFHSADLRDVAQIERLMQAASARSGAVDIIVNNAVIRQFAAIEDLAVAQWDASLAVNLSAAFHCTRLGLRGMKARRWGRIINLSSIYGRRGASNRVAYITTKTGLVGLTRAVAIETARTGITCNCLAPGTVPSPAILSRIVASADAEGVDHEEATRSYIAQRHPTERFVALESVGAMAVFLCSPAGDDITGTTIPIDGGWNAR